MLRKIRELTIEKNRIFEEYGQDGLEKMKNINIELNDLMKKAVDELQKRDTAPLLKDMGQKIIECYQIEEIAFGRLKEVVQ